MEIKTSVNRREFLKATGGVGSLLGFGLILRHAPVWALSRTGQETPEKTKTNIADALSVPRTEMSLPGPFPGRVVEVHDPGAMVEEKPVPEIVSAMFAKGISRLTGKNLEDSFSLFFDKDDVVGIKVNPVGPGLISTRLEVVDAAIDWLVKGGIKKENIIIWDRMDYMLTDAGFTAERYPGIGIEGLQAIDAEAFMGEKKDNISSIDANGHHISEDRFDMDTYYWADVEGPKDPVYLNQHVFNGKYSYFGKLLTQKLTKIINIPVFKNTASGISMATKNIGYGAICNTNRLHKPIFFNVNTEVHAFPVIRDKLVLNITDGLRAQCEGGPMPAAKFAYIYNRLFFATDPFALDLICHNQIVAKRKEMGIKTDEHPRWTEYLRYGERLGLGVANPEKIQHIKV
ncbi:MAG: DUF362 domain-containing protein [Candidatus Aminicenantes bacterium]|nr:DUF362 domain-containing protein [Candidatus Aminicenantes bacterium]